MNVVENISTLLTMFFLQCRMSSTVSSPSDYETAPDMMESAEESPPVPR